MRLKYDQTEGNNGAISPDLVDERDRMLETIKPITKRPRKTDISQSQDSLQHLKNDESLKHMQPYTYIEHSNI